MNIPLLRWPGGCFADTYHWKDGIGPQEERPSIVNVHWGGVTEDNSFGTHEFLDFCELIEAEPYININLSLDFYSTKAHTQPIRLPLALYPNQH